MGTSLGQGAHFERGANNGLTPLICASHNSHLDVVKYLIGQGAQIENPTIEGITALLYASREGHRDVVEYLVGQGAQVNRGALLRV